MDFWSKKQGCILPITTSGTSQKTPKEPKWNKPVLINMVRAITTRSGMRKTPTVEGTKKQPPLRRDINTDNTQRTEVSKETTSNTCEDNSKDTSIKEWTLFASAS